ncbi:AI-2E family transporter, partial [Candidatus Pacearchaeota archaeon]|nr:AI-2E family transporter [Candidatus Pacearchaeota archaeon]
GEQDLKKISLIVVILVLGVLVFFLLRPVMLSIIAGLILAYMFTPAYEKLRTYMNDRRSLAALIVSLFIILIIVIPLWFVVPLMLQQVFDIFSFSQTIELQKAVHTLFPTASPQFAAQVTIALNNFVAKVVTAALNSINTLFLDIPILSLHLILVFFVFFYVLRDGQEFRAYISDLSPFTKLKEKAIVQQFKNVTDSVIYGQIIVGLVQGSLAGLGLLIFGVENVLVLTTLAIFLSVFPLLGPFLVWIPVTVYLFLTGDTGVAFGYLLYNLLIVSTVDNILRTYLISRKTNLSPAFIFVSMVGGFLVFGIMGLLLGPLIVAYFLMFLQSYRDKTLQHLIVEKESQ